MSSLFILTIMFEIFMWINVYKQKGYSFWVVILIQSQMRMWLFHCTLQKVQSISVEEYHKKKYFRIRELNECLTKERVVIFEDGLFRTEIRML